MIISHSLYAFHFTNDMIFRYKYKTNDVFYSPNSFYKVYLKLQKHGEIKFDILVATVFILVEKSSSAMQTSHSRGGKRAGKFWMVDIGINAWSTLFLNLEIK